MQPIQFSLYSLRRGRTGISFESGRQIGWEQLSEVLPNVRLVEEVRRLALLIAAERRTSFLDLHVPLLNAKGPTPNLEEAVVERHGDAIYVVSVPNRAALAGYDLALACLLRMEKGLVLLPSRWLDAPVENTRLYKPVYRQISRVLQQRLREHLPAIWFSNPNSFDLAPVSQAMLMYQSSPCAAGETRQTICRDLLSPNTVNGIFHVTRWTLPPVLAAVQAKLKLAGHPRAASYRPSLAGEIIERQRKLGSHGRTILLTEQEIINAMTTAGVRFGELMANRKKTPGQRRKTVCRISEDLVSRIASALGRFVRPKDRLALTLTLMSEASRILERVTDLDEADPPCAA